MARGCVSRADLLLAVAALSHDTRHAHRLAACLGFQYLPPDEGQVTIVGRTFRIAGRSVVRFVGSSSVASLPVEGRLLHVAVTRAVRLDRGDDPTSLPPAEPLSPDAGKPLRKDAPPPAPPLVRPARLAPALRASLKLPAAVGLDLAALVRTLAAGRSPRRLPQRHVGRLGDGVWAVLDIGDAMAPYAADQLWMLAQLRRLYGSAQVRLWLVRDSPANVVAVDGVPPRPGRALPLPPPGQRVFVGAHVGLLDASRRAHDTWLRWLECAQQAQARVAAWLPCTAAWVDADLARAASLHCLLERGSLRRQRGRPVRATLRVQGALERRDALLVRASMCLELGPERLRELRLSSAALRVEPALEGLCWTAQPLVGRSAFTRALTPEGIGQLRPSWSASSDDEQRRIWQVMQHRQQWMGSFLAAAEVLVVAAHARPGVLGAGFDAAVHDARQRLYRLWSHARTGAASDVAAFAADLLGRQDADRQWIEQTPQLSARLQVLSRREQLPDGMPAAALAQAAAELSSQAEVERTLELRHDGVYLGPPSQPHAPTQGRFPLWRLAPARSVVVASRQGARRIVDVPAGVAEVRIASRDEWPLEVTTDRENVEIDGIPRPRWAHEWGRDERGLYALVPPLGPWTARFDAPGIFDRVNPLSPVGNTAIGAQPLERFNEHVVCQFGFENSCGVFADLTIHGITQRLRWIPPGEFWMGSTDAERARIKDTQWRDLCKDESPRHCVAITRGFWLADTACTQALWRLVMGDNPSDRKGDTLPVENVSYEDVERFLGQLQAMVPPGVRADLPTEAEWEYACRAGTETGFAFGDSVTHDQVNVDLLDDFGFPAGTRGRGLTVPVASLPPNAWGLHEMHGNVWEWCADDRRAYQAGDEAQPAQDPVGSQGPEAPRAVRGGSWLLDARLARSAYRGARVRSARHGSLGFRLALRSTSTGTSPVPTRDESAKAKPEARPRARRDAGPARAQGAKPQRSKKSSR